MARALRRLTLERDDYRCAVCGATEQLEVHHIVPRREGGANALENLVTLCAHCHNDAHERSFRSERISAADSSPNPPE